MSEKKRDLLQEISAERSAALDLLERVDRNFDALANNGYLNRDDRVLWEDVREFLRGQP